MKSTSFLINQMYYYLPWYSFRSMKIVQTSFCDRRNTSPHFCFAIYWSFVVNSFELIAKWIINDGKICIRVIALIAYSPSFIQHWRFKTIKFGHNFIVFIWIDVLSILVEYLLDPAWFSIPITTTNFINAIFKVLKTY